jgi:hypothetical protein
VSAAVPFLPGHPSWGELGQGVVYVAAVLGALATIWSKWLGPFLAKPVGRTIGKAIRTELRELVEEVVTGFTNDLLRRVGAQEHRSNRIEKELHDLDERVSAHQRKPHRFVGGP